MRVGVIGLGGAAERIHLPACRAIGGIELVGGCDPDADRRRDAARRHSLAATYASTEELFVEAAPELVIVGTPPDDHFDTTLAALERGIHVLCEKPFVGTVDEADRLIDEADDRGLALRVNTQYRFMNVYAEAERRLRAGEFGAPLLLQCWQQMYHPPDHEANWRAALRRSTLFEFGTHALDLVAFFFADHPVAVAAVTSDANRGTGVDLIVQATLRFADNRIATLAFNRVSHAPERYLEMRLDCEDASLRLSLGGVARASIDWSRQRRRPLLRANLVRGGVARVERDGGSRMIARQPKPAFASATAALLDRMVDEIRAGVPSNDAARFSREVLATALAGYRAAESGEWVRVERRGVERPGPRA